MKLIIDIPDDVYEFYKQQATEKNSLPTAFYFIANGTPYEERPQGEWKVLVDKYNVQTCKCSICGRTEVISHYDFDKIPFCHCGAKMSEGDKQYE